MEPDFSGYATRHNVRCADGLTILPDAFKHQDGKKVPLVWMHSHNDPDNVLGHAILENRPDGVYARAFFNGTSRAQSAKLAVAHKDIESMSIWANRLQKNGQNVKFGDIKEVSLVYAGANPGALIDAIHIQHGDGLEALEDEAIIYSGLTLVHADDEDETDSTSEDEVENSDDDSAETTDDNTDGDNADDISHAETDTEGENMADKTVKEVFDTLSPEQKDVVYYMLGEAINSASAEHSDEEDGEEIHSSTQDNNTNDQEDQDMKHGNVFEQNSTGQVTGGRPTASTTLSHSDMQDVLQQAKRMGSLKDAIDQYALSHGIEDIDVLFPDARAINQTPEFLKRRTEWVAEVMDGTHHTPFARIKTVMADITPDEARAKGYIKGNLKKEEFFKVTKRTTTPQTIYKKQKLERDDVVDITDFDVVAWVKAEMRLMLEEEIARAILVGDGRSAGDEDKIDEDHIRPILTDHELYVTTVNVNLDDEGSTADDIVDAITLQRHHYRGSGAPKFFCSEHILAKLLTAKDTLGRRLYASEAEVATALRVSKIVPVEVFEGFPDLIGILVDLRDYNVGTDRGGNVTMFDDFDIDYNQLKYLIETRLSGALVKLKSALVIKKAAASAVLVDPVQAPTEEDNVVTIPTQTGVTYVARDDSGAVITPVDGEFTLTANNSPATVQASPSSAGYYFATNADDEWTFVYNA